MKLNEFKTSEENFNYSLLTQPYGKFYIDNSKRGELIEYILDMKAQNKDFGLLERHLSKTDYEPLYYDFDFQFKTPFKISNVFLRDIITLLHSIIREKVVSPNLETYVLLKSKTSRFSEEKDYHKFGIHIIFPFIGLRKHERQYLYEQIFDSFIKTKFFDKFDLKEKNVKHIFDNSVISKNSIMIYGCNKANDLRYELHKIYNDNLSELENEYTDTELTDLLSIRKNSWSDIIIKNEMKVKVELVEPPPKKEVSEQNFDIDDIRKILSILSVERTTHYDDWIKVGLVLHNISSSSEMMGEWKKWSRQTPDKSKETNFELEWKKLKQKKNGGLNYGSLIFWAEQDDPLKFKEYYLDKLHKKIKNTLDFNAKTTPLPHDIAQVLKEMYYKKKYICSNLRSNSWFEFRKHKWVEIMEGFSLYNNISDELYRVYAKQEIQIDKKLISIKEKQLEPINESEREKLVDEAIRLEGEKVRLVKLQRCLKETSFKDKLMKECKNLFYDERFETNLNEKRNLLVFNNGVYDLDTCTFRDGLPDDYMAFSTRINFIQYDETLPEIHKIYNVFSQIHNNTKMFEFNFFTLASALHGYKREQIFNCWTGTGSNGKTLSVDFISKALGDYFHAPSITLLSRKRQTSSNASPDLYKLKGIRIAVLQEPEHDDQLNTSILKQLTGNDEISCRQLFKEMTQFKPQLSLFMSCNDLPKIPTTDGGTWRRIRVHEFKSKFVSTEPSGPNEFYADPSLPQEIENLAEAFMSVLLHYYDKLKLNNWKFEIPEEVLAYTKEYKKDNDLIQDFIEDSIEKTGNEKDCLKFKEIYGLFNDWFKENHPDKKSISSNDFKRKIEAKLGIIPHKHRGWKGYRIADEIEEETKNALI